MSTEVKAGVTAAVLTGGFLFFVPGIAENYVRTPEAIEVFINGPAEEPSATVSLTNGNEDIVTYIVPTSDLNRSEATAILEIDLLTIGFFAALPSAIQETRNRKKLNNII